MTQRRSPASILYDKDGNPVAVSSEGGTYSLMAGLPEQTELLEKIYKELKMLNFYMHAMTEEEITPGDING